MGKGKAESYERTLGGLLQLASCTTEFPGCRYAKIPKHPFGFKVPTAKLHQDDDVLQTKRPICNIVYVGMTGCKANVRGFYRAVGREIAHRFEFGDEIHPFPVHFLRKTEVYGFGDRDSQFWTWYEIGVGPTLFIIGHIINKGGYGEYQQMEDLVTLLSSTHKLQVLQSRLSCREWERRQFDIERVFEQNAATFKECAILHDYY